MELTQSEFLPLRGQSILRAWTPGILPALMAEGMGLREAQDAARARGHCLFEGKVRNLIVSAGKELVGDFLIDQETTGLAWHAIGTGSTTPSVSDTQLQTEVKRKQWTTRDRSGNVLTLSVFYTSAECTYNLQEAGAFGGAGASSTPNSGTLFSRYLQAYDNSAGNVDLTFDYTLTIG